MSATLAVTHKAIGTEVRRHAYDVVVDEERLGSVDMNQTAQFAIAAGPHTLRIRSGRNSSGISTFDAADGEVISFRCSGKRFLPLFLLSFVVPRLAIAVRRE